MLVHKSLCEWERGNQKPNSKNDEEKTWKRKFERYRPSLELGYYLFNLDFFLISLSSSEKMKEIWIMCLRSVYECWLILILISRFHDINFLRVDLHVSWNQNPEGWFAGFTLSKCDVKDGVKEAKKRGKTEKRVVSQ